MVVKRTSEIPTTATFAQSAAAPIRIAGLSLNSGPEEREPLKILAVHLPFVLQYLWESTGGWVYGHAPQSGVQGLSNSEL